MVRSSFFKACADLLPTQLPPPPPHSHSTTTLLPPAPRGLGITNYWDLSFVKLKWCFSTFHFYSRSLDTITSQEWILGSVVWKLSLQRGSVVVQSLQWTGLLCFDKASDSSLGLRRSHICLHQNSWSTFPTTKRDLSHCPSPKAVLWSLLECCDMQTWAHTHTPNKYIPKTYGTSRKRGDLRVRKPEHLLWDSVFCLWQRSCTHEISKMWLLKQDLHNDNMPV